MPSLKIDIIVDDQGHVAIDKIRGDFQALDQSVRKTSQGIQDHKKYMSDVTDAHNKASVSVAGLSRGILRLYAEYYVLQAAIGGVGRALFYGMEAVSQYNDAITTMAALITSRMKMNEGETLAEGYQRARKYAEGLVETLIQIDKHTSMNLTELTEMSQEMIRQGVILDTNNEEAVKGFTNVANALSAMVGNAPDRMRQIAQETRALLTGQTRESDKLAKSVASMTPEFEKQLEIHKKIGDQWQWLGNLLIGFTAAQSDVDRSWQATKSTLQTVWQQVLRGGFEPAYQDIIGYTKQLSDWAMEHKDQLVEIVTEGYTQIKVILNDIANLIGIIKDLYDPMLPLTQSILGVLYRAADGWGFILAAMRPVVNVMGQYLSLAMDLVSYLGHAVKLLLSMGTFNWSGMKQAVADMGNTTSSMVSRGKSIYGSSINLYGDMEESILKRESLKNGLVGLAKRSGGVSSVSLNSFSEDKNPAKKAADLANQYASALRSITDETTAWTNKIAEMNPSIEKQDSEILKLTNDANELIKRIQDQGKKGKVDVSSFISTIQESLGVGKEYIQEKERLKYHEEYIKMVSDEADFASTENERAINKIISQEQEKIEKLMDIWASGAISDQDFTDTELQIRDNAAQARIEIETETAKKIADINYNLINDISGMQDWAYKLRLEQIDAEAEKYKKDGAAVQAIEAWKEYQRQLATIQKTIAGYDMFAGFKAQADQYTLDMKTAGQQGAELFTQSHSAVKDSFSTLFSDLRTGELQSFSDYMSNFANKIASIWENMLAEMLANWIMTGNALRGSQSMEGTGGISGFLSKLLGGGSTFGGSTPVSDTATAGESFVDYAEYSGISWEDSVSESGVSFVNDIGEATSNFSTSMTGLFSNVTGQFSSMFGAIFSALGIGTGLGAIGGNSTGGSIGSLAGAAIGAIYGPIGSFIGSMLGGVIGGFFHEGGVVGSTVVPTRVFSPSVFASAPRLHNGLASDEFPAILQEDEVVIPKGKRVGGTTIIHNHYYQIKGSVVTTKSLARDLVPIMKQAVAGGAH